jgi:hypothetical protein
MENIRILVFQHIHEHICRAMDHCHFDSKLAGNSTQPWIKWKPRIFSLNTHNLVLVPCLTHRLRHRYLHMLMRGKYRGRWWLWAASRSSFGNSFFFFLIWLILITFLRTSMYSGLRELLNDNPEKTGKLNDGGNSQCHLVFPPRQ